MARKSNEPPPARTLDRAQIESGIRSLQKRIAELKAFDVSQVREQWDPRVTALQAKINTSLAEILGEGTTEFIAIGQVALMSSRSACSGNLPLRTRFR
jgi:hypothetical protein